MVSLSGMSNVFFGQSRETRNKKIKERTEKLGLDPNKIDEKLTVRDLDAVRTSVRYMPAVTIIAAPFLLDSVGEIDSERAIKRWNIYAKLTHKADNDEKPYGVIKKLYVTAQNAKKAARKNLVKADTPWKPKQMISISTHAPLKIAGEEGTEPQTPNVYRVAVWAGNNTVLKYLTRNLEEVAKLKAVAEKQLEKSTIIAGLTEDISDAIKSLFKKSDASQQGFLKLPSENTSTSQLSTISSHVGGEGDL